jgi:hypothetical protein
MSLPCRNIDCPGHLKCGRYSPTANLDGEYAPRLHQGRCDWFQKFTPSPHPARSSMSRSSEPKHDTETALIFVNS